ncbi:MAG: sortase [Chloroflexi bacterium]|nr:sortase [Chloroflexota bacterium]
MLISVLNIAGVVLLLSAAWLAWNYYNPQEPTIPADVITDAASLPSEEMPHPPLDLQTKARTALPAPAVLPQTNPAERTPEEGVSLADRKVNLSALLQYRSRAFPTAARTPPTRIVLPTIGVDSPAVRVGWKVTQQGGQQVAEWDVADYAVGWHQTSALPGAIGNTVMTGHNNINGEVFKNLIDLKVGDEIYVMADDKVYRYKVAQKLLIKEYGATMEQRLQNAAWIAPTDDVRLTLVSCWPYYSNTHRVIVVAKPAEGSRQ